MGRDKELGQLLMIGLSGLELTREETSFIKTVQPAGVIYFRRNVESPAQLRRLSIQIRKLLQTPPLIAIDHEGGVVARLSNPFTEFPGNDYLGRYFRVTGKVDLVFEQARIMAKELKSIGVNYNFTPVADVDSNPKNPIIGKRSFGSDPRVVARLVVETVKAYRKEKVISCAKHFPGHGDTFSDSHKVLPTVRTGKGILERRELKPFVAAIRAGVPTMMTAHVVYTALDPEHPATLSRKILQGILRNRLKYKGVIVSDDLEMSAIAKHRRIDSAAIECLQAGVDLLLVCKSLDHSLGVFESIVSSLKGGELKQDRLSESLRRVRHLKKMYDLPLQETMGKISNSGWPGHRRIAEKIRRFEETKVICMS